MIGEGEGVFPYVLAVVLQLDRHVVGQGGQRHLHLTHIGALDGEVVGVETLQPHGGAAIGGAELHVIPTAVVVFVVIVEFPRLVGQLRWIVVVDLCIGAVVVRPLPHPELLIGVA